MTTQTWPFELEIRHAGFRGTIDPARVTVPAGIVATYQVGFADVDPGFVDPITLAVLNLPAGAVATFDVNPCQVTDTVTLTIETLGLAVGLYGLEIEATY